MKVENRTETVRAGDYENVRDELKTRLEAIVDEEGHNIGTRVFKPEEVYRECRNIPPDLIVYFGNLFWRSVGSVGYNSIYTYENDTGPDDCNHAGMGIFILKSASRSSIGTTSRSRQDDSSVGATSRSRQTGKVLTKSIYDIAPTVLDEFGIDIPEAMQGQPI